MKRHLFAECLASFIFTFVSLAVLLVLPRIDGGFGATVMALALWALLSGAAYGAVRLLPTGGTPVSVTPLHAWLRFLAERKRPLSLLAVVVYQAVGFCAAGLLARSLLGGEWDAALVAPPDAVTVPMAAVTLFLITVFYSVVVYARAGQSTEGGPAFPDWLWLGGLLFLAQVWTGAGFTIGRAVIATLLNINSAVEAAPYFWLWFILPVVAVAVGYGLDRFFRGELSFPRIRLRVHAPASKTKVQPKMTKGTARKSTPKSKSKSKTAPKTTASKPSSRAKKGVQKSGTKKKAPRQASSRKKTPATKTGGSKSPSAKASRKGAAAKSSSPQKTGTGKSSSSRK
jgi:hypothetical protein